MDKYHKIQSIWKRDPENHYNTFIEDEWSTPEFEYLRNNIWEFTEKVDGTNIRIIWDGEKVKIRGKTSKSQIPTRLNDKLIELFVGKESLFMDKFGTEGNVCLYGEGYGAKIQKGGGNYISDDNDFVLFDVKIHKWWLERKDIESIARYFNIQSVPVIGCGTLYEAVNMVKDGITSHWGSFEAEGIVARPKPQLFDRAGERIITKIKHKDFK